MRPSCTWLAKTCVVYTPVFVEELQISRNCDDVVLLTVGGWGGGPSSSKASMQFISRSILTFSNTFLWFELLLGVFFVIRFK